MDSIDSVCVCMHSRSCVCVDVNNNYRRVHEFKWGRNTVGTDREGKGDGEYVNLVLIHEICKK